MPSETKKTTCFLPFTVCSFQKTNWLICLVTYFRDLANLANAISKKELEFSEPGRHKAEIEHILC